GDYNVLVTDANGCTLIVSITVGQGTKPLADAPANVTTCESYTLPALTNGAYFATTGGVDPIAAGTVITANQTIYVYVGDPTCYTENSFTVSINPNILPEFNPITDICSGASVITLPTTSLNNITGTWSPVFDNTATTTYTFTPSISQCATTAELTVIVNPIIIPLFDGIGPLCLNSAAPSLPGTSTNGITGTWIPAEITTAITGSTTYTFIPSAGQCSIAGNLVIEVNNLVITGTQITNSTDGLPNGQVTVIAGDGGSTSLSYSLDGINWFTSNVFTNLVARTYTAWVKNSNGCLASQLFVIKNDLTGKVEFIAGYAKSCINVPFKVPVLANGFTDISSFTIQLTYDPSAMNYIDLSQQNSVLNNGVTVTVLSSGVLQISFNTAASISLVNDNLLFNLNFSGLSSGKTEIQWNSFQCVVLSASGDKVPAIYTLGNEEILPAPQIVTQGSGAYCEGTQLNLIAHSFNGENLEYSWRRPDGSITYGSNLNLGPVDSKVAGEYHLTGINNSSCSTTQVVPVVVNPNPKPVLSVVGEVCSGQSVLISTETAYSGYSWQDGSTISEIQVDAAGLYWVTVTDNNNCKATDSIKIVCDSVIRTDELSIWLPNAFSPDRDLVNDIFRAKVTPDVAPATFQLLIFNKWGEEIFSSDDITKGWDGTFRGKPCPSDLYTWIITFTAPDKYNFVEKSPKRGVVMLLK
ncbi:MAG: gliding motility-associated C-terminal domain-containing protein, partial [Bacteroidales bacterium]